MKSGAQDLRLRTRLFGKLIVESFVRLPRTEEAKILGRQLLRAGTSIGAHYREAHRSRSDAEFISKLETALQELDETTYWMELLVDCQIVAAFEIEPVMTEANELIAIFTSIVKARKAKR